MTTLPQLDDPVAIARALLTCPSVTPAEGGAIDFVARVCAALGFEVHRPVFSQEGTPDIENLYARRGTAGPHLTFAGHTDVVPPGDAARWRHDPFAGTIEDGVLFGRGAVDMKGGIAAFLAALGRLTAAGVELPGSVSLLITGDEEGPSINGTVTVTGRQGHVAYPHLADNPIPKLMRLANALVADPLDAGNDRFQPSNLELVSLDVGNPSWNIIPREARARFNIRFNDEWSRPTLEAELTRRLTGAAGNDVEWTLGIDEPTSDSFLTRDDALIGTLSDAIETVVGRRPGLSTNGGTSDARFIKDWCPVVEFGLVGQTMHQVDERVAVADLETLTRVYEAFLRRWFETAGR